MNTISEWNVIAMKRYCNRYETRYTISLKFHLLPEQSSVSLSNSLSLSVCLSVVNSPAAIAEVSNRCA